MITCYSVVKFFDLIDCRKELYLSGGPLSITSRILIVDMLLGNIPIDLITGIIIMHAERPV